MKFLDSYLYLLTFLTITILVIVINFSPAKKWIFKRSSIIALAMAGIQFYAFVEISIFRIIQGGWFHILMGDMCPLISFCSIPLFIWHKEKTYKLFMPWLIIGSTLTILGGNTTFAEEGIQMALNSYIRHTVMLIQGILAYFWINKYQKKEYWKIFIFPAFNLGWTFLVGFIPWQVTGDIKWSIFSTGLLPTAFTNTTVTFGNNVTETYGSYAFIGDFGIPYPLTSILFYLFAVIVASLIVINKNYFPFYSQKIKVFFQKSKINLLKKS